MATFQTKDNHLAIPMEHCDLDFENFVKHKSELHVPWARYARPKHKHSVQEDGLLVPLNSEVSEETAAWLQNGRNTLSTIVNRALMFDLHRTHLKKLRITSHKQQL